MIRPLRRRHLWLVGATAAIAAPLYLTALAARPAPAVQKILSAGLAEPTAKAIGEGMTLPTTPPIRLRPTAGGAIEVTADGFLEGAELLLYWVPAEGPETKVAAHLLGALRGGERQVFSLPRAAATRPGVIFLYSLGHDEELAYTPWPAAVESSAR